MELVSIPTIIIISYLIVEVFKLFVKKKYLPIIAGVTGGVLGVIAYLIVPELIGSTNILNALAIGIVSGLASTGANQIIKQNIKIKNMEERIEN